MSHARETEEAAKRSHAMTGGSGQEGDLSKLDVRMRDVEEVDVRDRELGDRDREQRAVIASSGGASVGRSPSPAMLLALQRRAGNAAVASLVRAPLRTRVNDVADNLAVTSKQASSLESATAETRPAAVRGISGVRPAEANSPESFLSQDILHPVAPLERRGVPQSPRVPPPAGSTSNSSGHVSGDSRPSVVSERVRQEPRATTEVKGRVAGAPDVAHVVEPEGAVAPLTIGQPVAATGAESEPPTAAGAGGASSAGAAAPASPQPPTGGTPGELLGALTSTPATKAAATFAAVESASSNALDKQREQTQAALPQIPTPTGIPAAKPRTRGKKESLNQPALRLAGKDAPAGSGGKLETKQDAEVPEAPPAPAPRPTMLAGGDAPPAPATDSTTDSHRDPALEQSAQAAVENVGLPLDMIPTDAGPKPEVDLGGEADPVQMEQADQAAKSDVAVQHEHALAEVGIGRGENDIHPQPDDEILQAKLAEKPGPVQGGKGKGDGEELPPEVSTAVDARVTPILHQKVGIETEKYAGAQAEYQAGADAAHTKATADTRQLEAEARVTQEGAREQAQTEVTNARTDWHGEIEEVHQTFRTEAAAASDEHRQQVRGHVETGNREAHQHMQKAEQDAAAKMQKAETDAEKEKKEAKKESGGFWGWAKSKAKALVDGLKQAVNFIYDNLRKAVKTLFEAAKKLAMAAIELARTAIVGLIKAFGTVLKALVSVALAAFPDIRDKILTRIDAAVNKATDLVNQAAAALKKAVAAVLDFLASTIDKLLELVQDIYNGILTVVGMIVSGELAELLQKLGKLWAAAKRAPDQFETAAYEELLGENFDEPPFPVGTQAPGVGMGMGAEKEPATGKQPAADGEMVDTPQAPWSEDNVGVEEVVSGIELSTELSAELVSRADESGQIEFGRSNDGDRSLESLLGTEPGSQQQAPSHGQEGEQVQASDGLTPHERAEMRWTAMKQSLATWWSDNWPYVIGGGIAAVAASIAAIMLTGGAILGALVTTMTVLGPLFAGMMVAQLGGHLRDFLQKGWDGDEEGGGKALAKGLAAGAIELISWLTFKAGSVVMKGARAAAKGVAKGARAAGLAGAKSVRSGVNLVKRGANHVIKGGKVLLRGAGDAIERGAKSLRDLGERLLARTKFRGFRIVLNGTRFRLEGRINPWVLLADGTIKWKKRKKGEWMGDLVEVDGQKALILGRTDKDSLKDLFQARPQAADDMLALSRRKDVDHGPLLQALKDLSHEEAEELLKQVRQLKEIDEPSLFKKITEFRKEHNTKKWKEGGTVAAGQPDIALVDPTPVPGGSPRAQAPDRRRYNDRYKHPSHEGPSAEEPWAKVLQNHAEQTVLGDIADKIEAAYKGVKRPDEIEGTVKMFVDQEVCRACRSGFGGGAAGIIKQFSDDFPNVTLIITNTLSDEVLIVKKSKILGR